MLGWGGGIGSSQTSCPEYANAAGFRIGLASESTLTYDFLFIQPIERNVPFPDAAL